VYGDNASDFDLRPAPSASGVSVSGARKGGQKFRGWHFRLFPLPCALFFSLFAPVPAPVDFLSPLQGLAL
jgi:hypothetical protein